MEFREYEPACRAENDFTGPRFPHLLVTDAGGEDDWATPDQSGGRVLFWV